MNRSCSTISLALLFILCACRTAPVPADADTIHSTEPEPRLPANYAEQARNNSASLLYDLLKDERNLSKLLLIKRESKELHDLVKKISAAAALGATQLEQMAEQDRTLELHAISLPSGEVEARKSIKEAQRHELLHAKGADLQFKLLLTQIEALNYGAHLAQVAAAHEQQPAHQRTFNDLSTSLQQLREEVIALLHSTRE